jgi:hypothetical protein
MSTHKEIEKSVQRLAGTYLKDIVSFVICNVDSVDYKNRMCNCTPISGDANTTIQGVQLCAENSDGLVVYPKAGSTVIVALSTRNNAFILFTSEIDSLSIYSAVGGKAYYYNFNQDSDGVQWFNSDSYGYIPKVKDNDDSSAGLLKKINNLENLINDLINQYNTHTHTATLAVSGSSATGTTDPTIATETGNISPITAEADISNQYLKQGKPKDI